MIGSSTSFNAACATRSAAVGIPRDRTLTELLGIVFCRTRLGTYRRALRSSRSPTSSFSAPGGSRRGATPSTPGVRAPLLLRTRRQATTRNAGSYTKLYKSSKQRPGLAVAHRCSFACITRTRRPASERSGHGAPVFTSDLRDQPVRREHTGPLRHVTGFPDLGLLRVLRPTPPASAGNGPSRRPAGY